MNSDKEWGFRFCNTICDESKYCKVDIWNIYGKERRSIAYFRKKSERCVYLDGEFWYQGKDIIYYWIIWGSYLGYPEIFFIVFHPLFHTLLAHDTRWGIWHTCYGTQCLFDVSGRKWEDISRESVYPVCTRTQYNTCYNSLDRNSGNPYWWYDDPFLEWYGNTRVSQFWGSRIYSRARISHEALSQDIGTYHRWDIDALLRIPCLTRFSSPASSSFTTSFWWDSSSFGWRFFPAPTCIQVIKLYWICFRTSCLARVQTCECGTYDSIPTRWMSK